MNCTGKRCIMQYDKVDPATCPCVSYCPQATPPKTHADRIRAMTDEELAEWLDNVCKSAYDEGYTKDSEPLMSPYPSTASEWHTWLKQEVDG